jgi:tetratricopeptide (TPR) repeat protein
MHGLSRSASVTLSLSILVGSPGGHALAAEAAEAPAADLRERYFDRDFQGAYTRGLELAAASPDDLELRAWLAAAAAQADRRAEALTMAEELVEEHPGEAWSWFALAAASGREEPERALEASARALDLQPGRSDLVWMRAQSLSASGALDEAVAFLDENLEGSGEAAELLAARAHALYQQSFGSGGRDSEKAATALALYEQARRRSPSNVNAHFLAGEMLVRGRRNAEALPLLEEAVRLSPRASSIRSSHWRAIFGSQELSPEEKRARIEAGAEDLLARTEGDPASHAQALKVVRNAYDELRVDDRRAAIEQRILELYPDSPEAEWVHVARYRELRRAAGREGFTDPAARQEYLRLLWEFLKRPEFHSEGWKGDAYRSLFFELAEVPEADPGELLEVVWGMVEWEDLNPHISFARGAITLAERTGFHRAAEVVARMGIDAAREKVESRRSFYRNEGDYDLALKRQLGTMHDALGWVLYRLGRLEEAEQELRAAHDLNPKDRDNLYHLGQLTEARGDLRAARRYYVRGLAVQRPGDNPSLAALERLYSLEQGDLAGFDEFLASVREAEAGDRRAEILSQRIEDPEPAPPFALRDLEGRTHALSDYAGRILVVNFWGIWCSWCVIEMPELQALHESLSDDPEVALLTINNDRNPDDVPLWMAEKSFAFPVLLDDGYVAGAAAVSAFPTTWVLDRSGRIAFLKEGWSQELIEELTWRIDALRDR